MNYQKELELFLDYYMPNQSSDIRDAVELDKSFHVINAPKLLAVSGLDESYVLRLTDSWNAWIAAKAQAVPKVIDVGNELQSWVAVWSFKARHDREDYIVVDANLLAEKIEKLTGANA